MEILEKIIWQIDKSLQGTFSKHPVVYLEADVFSRFDHDKYKSVCHLQHSYVCEDVRKRSLSFPPTNIHPSTHPFPSIFFLLARFFNHQKFSLKNQFLLSSPIFPGRRRQTLGPFSGLVDVNFVKGRLRSSLVVKASLAKEKRGRNEKTEDDRNRRRKKRKNERENFCHSFLTQLSQFLDPLYSSSCCCCSWEMFFGSRPMQLPRPVL